MSSRNIIEINGRMYNAETGELVSSNVNAHSSKSAIPKKNVTVDVEAKPIVPPKDHAGSQKILAKKTTAVNHHAHHPEKATTLMRSAVSKTPTEKSNSKIHHTQVPASSNSIVRSRQLPATQAMHNTNRLQRAHDTHKNHMIRRFDDVTVAHSSKPATALQPVFNNKLPNVQQPAVADSPAQLLIKQGLAKADSHNQPAPKIKHHRHLRRKVRTKSHQRAWLISAGLMLIGLAAFLAYHNLATIDMQIASAEAGFHAELPAYRPASFHFHSPVQYSHGVVAISFNDTSGKNFTITQQSSNWDNVSLRDLFVSTASASYHAIQSGGRTIYIYGKGNATWVSGGVWFKIYGNGNLAPSQLTNIADSLH